MKRLVQMNCDKAGWLSVQQTCLFRPSRCRFRCSRSLECLGAHMQVRKSVKDFDTIGSEQSELDRGQDTSRSLPEPLDLAR